jgi:deoxyribonuclease V
MRACLDVAYAPDGVGAACLLFREWTDSEEAGHVLACSDTAAPYEPGLFYRRELPHLLAVLGRVRLPLQSIAIDGYAWLGPARPGLGVHLYEALGRSVPIVGVAKTRFRSSSSDIAVRVFRGESRRPLLVTSAGVDASIAAEWVRSMHGRSRIPTLLRRVDQLSRSACLGSRGSLLSFRKGL